MPQDQYHEDSFCPATCSMAELSKAVREVKEEARKAFLSGVWHARLASQFTDVGLGEAFQTGLDHFQIIHSAANGGKQ